MNIPQHIRDRKGPRSLKDLSPEVVDYLNQGLVETKNLMEWLGIDQLLLLNRVLTEIGQESWYDSIAMAVAAQKKPTANSNVKVIGQNLGVLTTDSGLLARLRGHTSDMVRSWVCWAESLHYDAIPALLKTMKPYAADPHFGVREVVIFATKPRLIEDLDTALKVLSEWVLDGDENVRRYAVETLRPVGVWTKKIAEFQTHPDSARNLIEPVNSDPSKYVRDSVGNWLNDASKTSPEWVQRLCTEWEMSSPTKETAYIIKKAMRTLNAK